MFNIKITVSEDELVALAKAIKELNSIQHLRYMSRAMLANTSGIKDTKVRAVLQELLDKQLATQYAATQNPKLQRYYYVLTDAGEKLLQPGA